MQKRTLSYILTRKKHANSADLLTKFDIENDTPQYWLDLQKQLINAHWLQQHPDTWYMEAVHESQLKIQKQACGSSGDNQTQTNHIDVNKPAPLKLCQNGQDWSMIDAYIKKQRLRFPKSIFRMIGWTTLAALKWLDNTRVKKFRAKN